MPTHHHPPLTNTSNGAAVEVSLPLGIGYWAELFGWVIDVLNAQDYIPNCCPRWVNQRLLYAQNGNTIVHFLCKRSLGSSPTVPAFNKAGRAPVLTYP